MKNTDVAFKEKDFYRGKNLDINIAKPSKKFETDNEFLDYLSLNGFEKQLEFVRKPNEDNDEQSEDENIDLPPLKEIWIHQSNKVSLELGFSEKAIESRKIEGICCHFHSAVPKAPFEHDKITYINDVGRVSILNPNSEIPLRMDSYAVKLQRLNLTNLNVLDGRQQSQNPIVSTNYAMRFYQDHIFMSDINAFYLAFSKFIKEYKLDTLGLSFMGNIEWLRVENQDAYELLEVKENSYAESFIFRDTSDEIKNCIRYPQQMDHLGSFLSALNFHFTQQYFWSNEDQEFLNQYSEALRFEHWREQTMLMPSGAKLPGTRGFFDMAVLALIAATPKEQKEMDVNSVLGFLRTLSTQDINDLCCFNKEEKHFSLPSLLIMSCLTLTPTLSSVSAALPVIEQIFDILEEKRTVSMEWSEDLYQAVLQFSRKESLSVFETYKEKIENFVLKMNLRYPEMLKVPKLVQYHHYNFETKIPFKAIDKQIIEFDLSSCLDFDRYVDQRFGFSGNNTHVKSELIQLLSNQVLEREIQNTVKPVLSDPQKTMKNTLHRF